MDSLEPEGKGPVEAVKQQLSGQRRGQACTKAQLERGCRSGVGEGVGGKPLRRSMPKRRWQGNRVQAPVCFRPLGMLSSATAWKLSGARQRANDVFIR